MSNENLDEIVKLYAKLNSTKKKFNQLSTGSGFSNNLGRKIYLEEINLVTKQIKEVENHLTDEERTWVLLQIKP